MLLLSIIEPLAIADRSRKSGLKFPNSYEALSQKELQKRLGSPIEWNSRKYARPCAGQDIVFPLGVRADEAGGLLERAKFYELKGVGGILVLYSTDNVAVSPAIVYLETNKGFVALKGRDDLSKRLDWEGTKLRQLRKWLAIPEDVVMKDGEFVVASEGKDER